MRESFFKTLVIKIQMAFCGHSFAFVKSDVIGGRRVAVHVCMKCRKMHYLAYGNEYDRERLLTDMIFGAGCSFKN